MRRTANNLPAEETVALKDNPNIVIRKADRNSNMVILDKDDILKEGYSQLRDNGVHYEPTDSNNIH